MAAIPDLDDLYKQVKKECQSWPYCHGCEFDHDCVLRPIFELAHAVMHGNCIRGLRPTETINFNGKPQPKHHILARCEAIQLECEGLREAIGKRKMDIFELRASVLTYLDGIMLAERKIHEIATYQLKDE